MEDCDFLPTLTPSIPRSTSTRRIRPPSRTGKWSRSTGLSFTFPTDMTGHPAVTVPVGWTDDGLPVGSQLIGPHLDDAVAIEASAAYEAATRYDRYFPDAWGPRSGDSALAPRDPNGSSTYAACCGRFQA